MKRKVFASILLLRRFLMTRAKHRRGELFRNPYPPEFKDTGTAEKKMLEWVNRDVQAHIQALEEVENMRRLLEDAPAHVNRMIDERENEVMRGYYLRNIEEQRLCVERFARKIALVASIGLVVVFGMLPRNPDESQLNMRGRVGRAAVARVVRVNSGGVGRVGRRLIA